MSRKKQAEPTSWVVKARCVVLKEYVIEGTREEAASMSGKHIDERDLDLIDWDVQSVEPNE